MTRSIRQNPVSDQTTAVRHGGVFTATLTFGMAMGTVVQFALGALGPFLTSDLELSRAGLGLLVTLFFTTSALSSPVAGRWVDRFGPRRLLVMMFLLSATGSMAMGAAPTAWTIAAAAAVAGVGMGVANPATNRLVSEYAPPRRQSMVMAWKQSGVQLGALLSGAALPSAAAAIGWRGTMFAIGGVSLLGGVVSRLVIPGATTAGTAGEADAAGRGDPQHWAVLRRSRSVVRWLSVYAFFMGGAVAAIAAHLPLYAVQELGMSATRAGFAAAMVGLTGILGRLGWGRLADRFSGAHWPLLAMALAAMIGQVAMLLAAAGPTWLLWIGAAVFGATAAAWNGLGMLAIIRGVDVNSSGRASGLVLLWFFSGLVATPISFGWVADRTGTYAVAWMLNTGMLAMAAVVAAAWTRALRRLERSHVSPGA